MAGALLDTSVLIAPPSDLPPSAAISVITVGELRAGVLLAKDEVQRTARAERLVAVRAAFRPIPVDDAVAERYGDVLAAARRERRQVKASDLLIIATALSDERRLITLDQAQQRLAASCGVDT